MPTSRTRTSRRHAVAGGGGTNPPPSTSSPSPSLFTTGPASPPSGLACRIDFAVASSWPGGFTENVTVTNSGTVTWHNWTVRWTAPAGVSLVNGWSATVTTSGSAWTATAPSWAADLAPGASTSFGFQANGPSSPGPSGISCS